MTLEGAVASQRPILAEYSPALLDQMIAVVTASTVTAYALYTMSPQTVAKFHTQLLPATLPFVLYGVFRYLYLVFREKSGENPVQAIFRDPASLINGALYAGAVALVLYR